MMFICLIRCLLIVSVDPDIGNKTTCLFDHKIVLEKLTNHLQIINSLSWKDLEPWKKAWNSLELFFMPKEALSRFWNHPEELKKKLCNIPEYKVLFYI